MPTPQHTPGPWHTSNAFEASGPKLAVWPEGTSESAALNPICVIAPLEHLRPVDWRNATLIAAAPDLLAMLQEICDNHRKVAEMHLETVRRLDPGSDHEYHYPDWFRQAEAVVGKATTPLTL